MSKNYFGGEGDFSVFTVKVKSLEFFGTLQSTRSATQIYITKDKTPVRTSNPDCKFICDWNGDCCPEKQPRPIHTNSQTMQHG